MSDAVLYSFRHALCDAGAGWPCGIQGWRVQIIEVSLKAKSAEMLAVVTQARCRC